MLVPSFLADSLWAEFGRGLGLGALVCWLGAMAWAIIDFPGRRR